jgi:DNA repair exonuclease SbcCD nuclease subunit
MKIALLSDLHLGKTQFAATVNGRNTRSVDIERAWAAAVQEIVIRRPSLVLVGGDIFDSIRPSFHAVKAWQNGVRRIVGETDAHLLAILGNHCGPRTTESLSPVVVVDGEPRVHVVTEPKRVRLVIDGCRVSVDCFPFTALSGEETYALGRDPDSQLAILLMHAAVKSTVEGDSLPYFYAGDRAIDVGREADSYDLISLGDYHERRQLVAGKPVFYPGALERTTSDIWREKAPKGFIVYDTDTMDHEFVEIPTRPVLDVTPRQCIPAYLDATQLAGHAEVNAAVQGLIESPETKDAIVRLVVERFPRQDRDRIDWSLVRELKHRALHFELTLRLASADNIDIVDRRLHATPLIDQARQFLADYPADVRACCIAYLETREAA